MSHITASIFPDQPLSARLTQQEVTRHVIARSSNPAMDVFDDLQNGWIRRALTGADLEATRLAFGLNQADFASAFGVVHSAWLKLRNQRMLSVEFELLLRLYLHDPRPAPWLCEDVAELFDRFYGPLLSTFDAGLLRERARMLLYRRFAAMTGRSGVRALSWVETGRKADRPVKLIFAKASELADGRRTLEALAEVTWFVRGSSLEASLPLPSLADVQARRPGRVAGTRRSRLGPNSSVT